MRQPISVLHVDDEPDFAEMATVFLEREMDRLGVRSATSANEALEVLAEARIDCIVSDYEMPDLNGIEFLEAVRDRYPDLPFILYTGKGSEEIASEAISAGVTDYLQKGTGTSQYAVLANRIENLVSQYRAETSLENTRHRYQRLIEESSDVFVILDRNGNFEYVSPSVERVFGHDAEELEGELAFDHVHPEDHEAVLDRFETLLENETTQATVECRLADDTGTWRWIEARGRNLLDDSTIGGIVIYTRDITDRKGLERVLKQLHNATRNLLRAETKQEAAEMIGNAANDILGYSNNVVRLLTPDGTELEPVALVSEDLPTEIEKRPIYEVGEETAGLAFERGEPIVYDDVTSVDDNKARHGARAGAYLPIGEHGVLTITEYEPDVFDETDIQLASILTANAAIAFDRIVRENERESRLETLSELNERTARLFRASTPEAICEVIGEAARDVLGYPNTVVRLLDEDKEVLEPIVVTEVAREELGERPEYPIGEGTAGQAYTAQEPLIFDDVGAIDDEYHRKDGRAAIYLPIGEYGTISIADTTPGSFDESDVELARLLMGAAEAALYRVNQQRTLERQNERLDKFASVVSHELQNPLNVASGRLALLGEDCESEHLDAARDAVDRMDTLLEDLRTLALEGNAVADGTPVPLSRVVESSWKTVETPNATLLTAVGRSVQADESRLKQLFENLIKNGIEHGSGKGRPSESGDSAAEASTGGQPSGFEGNDSNHDVTITVGELEDGFYVADDGRGIPAAEREDVFDVGYSTRRRGNGFGLSIVKEIVDAHGWEIAVTESEAGGARFEITGVDFVGE